MLKTCFQFIHILTVTLYTISCNPKAIPEKEWAGTKWQLVTIDGSRIATSTGNQIPYLEFDLTKKTISGNGGCNSYGGSYDLKDNNISFTNIFHTEMACDALDTEVLFFQKFSEVKTFVSKPDILQLLDASGNIVLELKAVKL